MRVVYKSEKGEIILGDCLEVMQSLGKYDLIILDPPYIAVRDSRAKWNLNFDWHRLFKLTHKCLKDNGVVFLFGLPSFYMQVSKYILAYFDVYFDLIWLKPVPLSYTTAKLKPLNRHEQILCLVKKNAEKSKITYNYRAIGEFKGKYVQKRNGYDYYIDDFRHTVTKSDGLRYPTTVIEAENKPMMSESERTEHPTQKPEKLIEFLVKGWTNEGDKVLDPFLGSGTTAVVCEKLNRLWTGIEIDEKWCKIAIERVSKVNKQTKLTDFC